jgi:hypothetical protein
VTAMLGKRRKTRSQSVKNSSVASEVEKTLAVMSSVPSQAPPFFYSRLKARMENRQRSRWERWYVHELRPALAVVAVTLLLLINLYCVWKASEVTGQAKRDQAAASIAEDYDFTIDQY